MIPGKLNDKMKNVIIAGASGMIGGLIIQNCLDNDEVRKVHSMVRKPSGIIHPKLQEIICDDFLDFSGMDNAFLDIDVAFFCIGVYTGAVSRQKFKEITVDYPVSFAKMLHSKNDSIRFCLLSGAGADRTEKSKMMFAKDKGMAENLLEDLKLGEFYSFRPSYIYPVEKRNEPNFTYRLSRILYKPLISKLGKNMSIPSTILADGMVKVGLEGASKSILENRDILEL